MKKLINICLLCLLTIVAAAQTDDRRYQLTVKTLPVGVITVDGYFYPPSGWSWERITGDDNGQAVSQVPAGGKISLTFRDRIGGYQLKSATANGLPVSTSSYNSQNSIDNYIMPEQDVEMVVLFEYDPGAPDFQPGAGSWDPETGTLILDGGYNGSWPAGFDYNTDREKVLRFIIGGESGYYYSLQNFPNCTFFDASRTSWETIEGSNYGNGRMQNLSITECVLPATLKSIGSKAFQGTVLQTLVCFATTPPALSGTTEWDYDTQTSTLIQQNSFPDCPDMVVRVPEEAVALYQQAPGWKDFSIVPMTSSYVNLRVQLMAQPDAEVLAQYKNMQVELTSLTNGQVRRLLMTGRNDYAFNYLPENTNYSLALRNARGDEVARIDNIFMETADKEVVFPALKGCHKLSATVMAGGEPVGQALYQTTWLRASGEFLGRGNTIEGMLDGDRLRYLITIDGTLATQYQLPDTLNFVVGQQADDIVYALQPIPEKEVTFVVVDSLSRQGIGRATIQVAQLFARGERGATSTLTTAADGRATAKLPATVSAVTVTSPMHGSQTMELNLAATNEVRIAFLPANGTTVQLSYTYQPAVKEGAESTVQSNYSDDRNLEHTFTAVLPDGRDSVVTQFIANHPVYTFYNDLPQGTKLRVGAESVTGSIEPVEAEATVGDNRTVNVTLPIVERGYIYAHYYSSESNRPALLVFDAATGELKKRDTFNSDSTLTVTRLQPGEYVVAAMSTGLQYAAISSLTGLMLYSEGSDYVAQTVSIADGHWADVVFPRVPLATTQLETNLERNRASWSDASVTIGYNVTLSTEVAFQGLQERMWGTSFDDALYPTDCKLEVYLPDGLTAPSPYRAYTLYHYGFNQGMVYAGQQAYTEYGSIDDLTAMGSSIIVSPATSTSYVAANSTWDEAERKLTIDWPHIDEVGKMVVNMIPLAVGSFKPEVYLTYTLNGKPCREMIASESLVVSRSDISVPELVISPTFTVSGKAMYVGDVASADSGQDDAAGARRKAGSAAASTMSTKHSTHPDEQYYEVTVMDGDVPIGKATINAEGEWQATCTLVDPLALSRHNIYAHIAYPEKTTQTMAWDMGGYYLKTVGEGERFSYNTPGKELLYDPNGVVPLSVTMSFFNHHPVHLHSQEIFFDLQAQKATPRSYGYSNEDDYNTDFTFEINLSNNDTTKVYAVDLAIYTEGPDAESFVIPAHYNAHKDRWIAYEKFNTRSLPYNVSVKPYYYGDPIGSRSMVQQVIDNYNDWFRKDEQLDSQTAWLNDFIAQIERAISAGDESLLPDLDALLPRLYELDAYLGFDTASSTVPAADVDMTALQKDYDRLTEILGDLVNYYGDNAIAPAQIGQLDGGANFGPATGLTRAGLIASGFETMVLDDGSELFIKAGDDGSLEIVDLTANIVMRNSGNAAGRRAASGSSEAYAMELYNKLSEAIDDFKGNLDNLSTLCSNFSDLIQVMLHDTEKVLKSTEEGMRFVLSQKNTMSNSALAGNLISRSKALIGLQAQVGILKQLQKGLDHFRMGRGIGTLASLYALVSDFISFYTDTGRLIKIRNSLPSPCPGDQARRDQLSSDILTAIITSLIYQVAVIANDVTAVYVAATSVSAAVGSGGAAAVPSLVGIAESLLQMGLSLVAKHIYTEKMKDNINEFAYSKKQLQCNKDKDKKKKKTDDDDNGGTGGGSTPTLDPSGFVYEGVPSNRLEGVTTTVYYKRVGKNLFGDDVEQAIPWQAEDYGQVNPQLTDENGEYGWMVPTGMWQVKYEKQGYQTEYSEWLPVPPPQLDVNQPMTQFSEPVVSEVRAMPRAVLVRFDKFMQPSTLTPANISVSRGGQNVGGTLEPLYNAGDTAYAQQVRFVPTTALPAGQTLRLTVSGDVMSYAGIMMGEAFSQEFTIEQAVERIVADSAVHVVYDQPTTITVQALPAEAAAGKMLVAKILSGIAKIESNHLPSLGEGSGVGLDANGRASITITGEAHGTTGLLLQMQDDADVQTVVVVDVKDETDFVCPAPEANYVSGIDLAYGATIELSCSLPEATIYYTADGSCPCDTDSPSVKRYTGPIALTSNMTLKAMATAPGYADSDVAEFHFLLTDIVTLPTVQPQPAQGTYNMAGQKLRDDSALTKGVYIIDGRKVVVK